MRTREELSKIGKSLTIEQAEIENEVIQSWFAHIPDDGRVPKEVWAAIGVTSGLLLRLGVTAEEMQAATADFLACRIALANADEDFVLSLIHHLQPGAEVLVLR